MINKKESTIKKTVILLLVGLTSFVTSGCASGGFNLTTKYAAIVNRQHIVLRVVLYILTIPIYGVTLIADAVVFNSIDFWEGRVSANEYILKKETQEYIVNHSYQGKERFRKTKIEVYSLDGDSKKLLRELVIAENAEKEILFTEAGVLKTKVKNIYDLPEILSFKDGKIIERKLLTLVASR